VRPGHRTDRIDLRDQRGAAPEVTTPPGVHGHPGQQDRKLVEGAGLTSELNLPCGQVPVVVVPQNVARHRGQPAPPERFVCGDVCAQVPGQPSGRRPADQGVGDDQEREYLLAGRRAWDASGLRPQPAGRTQGASQGRRPLACRDGCRAPGDDAAARSRTLPHRWDAAAWPSSLPSSDWATSTSKADHGAGEPGDVEVSAFVQLGVSLRSPVAAMRNTRYWGRTTSALYSWRSCIGSSPWKNRRVNSAQRKPGRISIFRRTGASVGFQAR
jgi:hypothetical protein